MSKLPHHSGGEVREAPGRVPAAGSLRGDVTPCFRTPVASTFRLAISLLITAPLKPPEMASSGSELAVRNYRLPPRKLLVQTGELRPETPPVVTMDCITPGGFELRAACRVPLNRLRKAPKRGADGC